MNTSRPIAHFEEKYVIHITGQVWNKGKHVWQAQTQNPNGYMKVLLSLNGERKQFLVHQLVARHFLPNPYDHEQVDHIDGNKTNNDISNLEWVSRSENIQRSLEIGLRKGFMSLDDKFVLLGRVLAGEALKALAEETGRHPVVLSKMLRSAAEKCGRSGEWVETMKQRRKDAAIRNLERINHRDPERSGSLDP